jgi:tetratricopeptide (TPR) repeat protein
LRALQRQQPERAARLFRDPLWQGIAYYRAGDYRAAARLFQQLKTPLARYDLGNALVHLGDLEGARAAYRQALAMDPGLTDARHNLALVEKALAEPAQTPDRKIPPKPGKPQGGGRPVPPKPPGSNLDSRASRGRDAQRKETKRSSQGGAPVPGEEAKRNVEVDHHKTASEPAARGEPSAGRPAAEKRGAQRQQTAHRPSTATPPGTAGDVQRKTEGHPNKRIEATTETARPKGDKGGKPRAKEAGRAGPRSSSTGQPPTPSPRPSLDRRNVDTLEIWLDAIHDDPAELLRALFRQQARGGSR